jgi:hypothetical protein
MGAIKQMLEVIQYQQQFFLTQAIDDLRFGVLRTVRRNVKGAGDG